MFALILVLGCSREAPCILDDQARALLPADGIDCHGDLSCLVLALEEGRPAMATSSTSGIDSVLTTAHVWTGERFWWLTHDSYSYSPGNVDGRECVGPHVVYGAVECESVAPEGNHYAVCGHRGFSSPPPLPFEP